MTRLDSGSDTGLPVVFVNGQPTDQISVYDRAFQYGDGLFETIAVIDGKPALLERHLQRLENGLSRLAFPEFSIDSIVADIREKSRPFESAVLKLVISRGESQRGYLPPPATDINVVLFFSEKNFSPDTPPAGVSLCFCSTTLGINPQLAGMKHLNRLEQVLAKKESSKLGFDDALVADIDGNIIEATSANLFLWEDGKLLTPDLQRCGINGVVRQLVLSIAKQMDIPVEIRNISKQDCLAAEALFLTNSVDGIKPVSRLSDISFDEQQQPLELYREIMNHVYS